MGGELCDDLAARRAHAGCLAALSSRATHSPQTAGWGGQAESSTVKIVLVTSEGRNRLGKYEFPAVPRIGESITLRGAGPWPVEAVHFRVQSEVGPAEIEVVLGKKR
jgi:hypothetical protein